MLVSHCPFEQLFKCRIVALSQCRNVANSFLLPVAMSPCRHYEMSQRRISWSAM